MDVCQLWGRQARRGSSWNLTHLGFYDALDQNQAPRNDESLNRVGKGMRLVGPGDVGRGHKQDGNAAMARRGYQFMQSPVFENEADEKHEDS